MGYKIQELNKEKWKDFKIIFSDFADNYIDRS